MSDFLVHHGVIGQKWGVRRYQYQDGSYTPEGRIHYDIGNGRQSKNSDLAHATEVQLSKDPITPKEKKKILSDDAKKALMIVGGVALAAGVAYGVYAVSQNLPPETTASILEAVGANGAEGSVEEQIESVAKVIDSNVINKTLEKPIESVVPKDVSEAINKPISEAANHEYTIEGSERANELFNSVMNEPMKFAMHHRNPVTWDHDMGKLSPIDYGAIKRGITKYIEEYGIPENATIKGTPDYGIKQVSRRAETGNERKVYEFAKAHPDVLAFSNSMFADAYGKAKLCNLNKLTDDEASSATKYSGNPYRYMNDVARGLADQKTKLTYLDDVNNLTNAIRKHSVPEDILIHRSIRLNGHPDLQHFFNQENLIGQTFFDKGFGSNSLSNYDVALNSGDPSRMVIHSIAPKGTKAMYMEDLTTSEHELELLLQRGSGYKVLDVVKDSNGRITDVFAQIVQNGNLEDV